MKTKPIAILLIITILSFQSINPVFATRYKLQQTVQQLPTQVMTTNGTPQQQSQPYHIYVPGKYKAESAHPVRDGLIGVGLAGVVAVGLFILLIGEILEEGGMIK